ncbi:hypothetical protein DPMN_025475 [Dreissena polymorpha]|uniref:Uncharacterized protein n=1 Tax=Dreissena polymorpha TaxID=45954 RepID=A0A9D4LPW4_DREPO|nr:hypothetical protein DPMN_025475 [Dreissena polymorpha]
MKTVTSIVYTSDLINILTKFHKDWMKTINILTKFQKDWMKTVTSTVYTNKLLTINILTKFHKDWTKTATSIINILTKFHKDWMKTATSIINILTKFHKDWMKTATSIVYTSKINILTKFHKDWMKTVTSTVYTIKLLKDASIHARTYGRRTSHGHRSSPCHFANAHRHDDWEINVLCRVFTRCNYCHMKKTSMSTGSLWSIIIGTNVLTKFHEDFAQNVASKDSQGYC